MSPDKKRIRVGQAFFVLFATAYLFALLTRKEFDYSFVLLVIAIGFFLIALYESYKWRKDIQLNKEAEK